MAGARSDSTDRNSKVETGVDSATDADCGAMRALLDGYARFRKQLFPRRKELFAKLSHSQSPQVLFLACSDSRIAPDLIVGGGPGDLFVVRNAGNIVPAYGEAVGGISASVEYAVAVLKVRAIVICGHSDCGAMKGLKNPGELSQLPAVARWLRHAEAARCIVEETYAGLDDEARVDALVHENVLAQMVNLQTHPSVARAMRAGNLKIYGWVYEIERGEITAYDAKRGRFVPLDASMPEGVISGPPAASSGRSH
jgi:carbonic anhydrase